jgi:hypothetical protein
MSTAYDADTTRVRASPCACACVCTCLCMTRGVSSRQAVAFFKNVLFHDASNVEAIASLAAHHFYTDQPEIALRWAACVTVCVVGYVCGGVCMTRTRAHVGCGRCCGW